MSKILFRAMALVILLAMFVSLSDIDATASLLIENGQSHSCCEHAGKDDSEQEDSCALANCPCCTGATFLHSRCTDLCHEITSRPPPIGLTDKLKLSACYHSIEYPPELS